MVITFLILLSRRGFAAFHVAHVLEQEPLDVHGFLLVLLERYLAFKTCAQGEWSSDSNFQSSLAIRAKISQSCLKNTQPTMVFRLSDSVPVH